MRELPQAPRYASAEAVSYDAGLRQYMLGVYNYMAGGVALTGLVAYLVANVPFFLELFYTPNAEGFLRPNILGMIAMFAPLAFILFGFRMDRITVAQAQTRFWLFAGIMGLSMANIFLAYTGISVARVFLITAISFGALSMYGYTTKKDMTALGSFLIMGVVGLIVASIVNIFMASSALHFAISVIGVLLFAGLTAYDTQMIRRSYYAVAGNAEMAGKMAIQGALALYLDFINLFQFLLQFLGNRD